MNPLEKYPELKDKGLNEEETQILVTWLEQGKPGLAKVRADRFGDMYLMGYSCQEIHRMFPEYPLETLLFARAHYNWDKLRRDYQLQVQENTMEKALTARLESIKFLSELISATHIKWRKEILTYLMNPEKEKAPDCLPKSVMGYGQVMSILQNLIAPPAAKGGGGSGQQVANGAAVPLVSVNVSQGNGKPDVVITSSSQEDIREALLAEVAQGNKDGNK